MAVTNGWGQAAKNNTNGFGKLATNNIGAGSIYENSYSGDTALIGTSAAFGYSAASFTQADSNPTPTITGTTGGVFSGTSGLVFVSTLTGEINLSASTIAAHVVTYTVDGVSATFNLSVTAAPFSNQFSFDFAIDEYIDASTFNYTATDFSVSIWMKQPSSVCAFYNFRHVIAVRNAGGSGADIGRITYAACDAKIAIGSVKGSTTLNDDNWHNLVWTVNRSTGDIKAYVDGNSTPEVTGTVSVNYSPRFRIGAYTNAAGSPSRYYTGLIDEVSIWDTVLSGPAITEIYNSNVPNNLKSHTNASNLASWYRMGEEATYSNPGGTGIWTLTDQGNDNNNASSINMEEADRKSETP